MSVYYKRLFTQKIIKKVFGTGSHELSRLRLLEKKINRLIKVQHVQKQCSRPHQFRVSIPELAASLEGKLDCQHMQDNELLVDSDQGFLYFKVDSSAFVERVLRSVREEGAQYGYGEHCHSTQCVCVEFSSPNIAKPFHVGHLRSTIIGNVISNLYEAAGNDVKRINFLGDWGTQFGLLTLGLQKYTNNERLKADPLHEMFQVYTQINQDVENESGRESNAMSKTYQEGLSLFSKLEKGDPSLRSVWQEIRNLSVEELNKMYERLGVHFTHLMSESKFHSQTDVVLQKLKDADLLQFDTDGVGYATINNEKDIGRANIVKSDGSSLYLSRDIAAALDRQTTFSCDRMHYVVEMGQRSHFIKLISVLRELGVPWAQSDIDDVHIRFGRVKGMSTRQGKVVFLRNVLDEARSRVAESMLNRSTTRVDQDLEDVADRLGVSAIVLQDLKAHRANDYTFSWDRMLNFKADSGVFVQYCHARLCSMLSNCGVDVVEEVDTQALTEDDNLLNVVLHLARYPDVFDESLSRLEPHLIVQYLFRLCHLVNGAYSTCPVKGQNLELAQARLLVFVSAKQVLANSLQILGLQPLDKI